MRDTEFVTFDKANEIVSYKLTFNIEQWMYINESLLALQPTEYKFDETCDDLAFEFLQLDMIQGFPFLCGKFFGGIQKSMYKRIMENQKRSDRVRKLIERGKQCNSQLKKEEKP